VGVGQRALSLSAHTAGGPPPLPAPGRVTPPRHILGVRLVLLWGRCHGKRVVLTIRERASTPPFTQEVPVAGALSAAAFASGVGGMDLRAWRWRRTCTSLPLNISQRGYADTRRHRLRPADLATVIHQVSAFLKAWNWSLWPTRLTLVFDVPIATSTLLPFQYA
jgi:hypothetical protein